MTRAIVPGTFDPITEGHLDIIRRAAQIFDEVVVGVAESPSKHPLFSHEERVELARQSVEGLGSVAVEPFSDLLTDFAARMDAKIVVKGLRAITDFEYEFQQTAINFELSRELETVFIMSPPKFMYLSSSIVRELARLDGAIDQFVPPCVKDALVRKYDLGHAQG